MKKKKKIIIALITIIILILIISIISKKIASKNNITEENSQSKIEENEIKFKINDITCKENEEFNIEIEMLENSDFVAANFSYEYDDSKIEYVGYETGESFSDAAMVLVNKDSNSGKILIGYVANPQNEENSVKAGKIMILKFKAKNTSSENVENELKCTTLKKQDGENINFNILQGKIKIQ